MKYVKHRNEKEHPWVPAYTYASCRVLLPSLAAYVADDGTRGKYKLRERNIRQSLLTAPSFLLSACTRKRRHICGAEYASFRCMVTGGLRTRGSTG